MTKKDQEVIIIEMLRKCYPDFPKGKIIMSEAPDFIFHDGPKKKTGVELVQLVPPPQQHYNKAGILFPKYAYLQIENTLKLKEAKLASYINPKIQEMILLIHYDTVEGSKRYDLFSHIERWSFESGFDKVLLFELFDSQVYKIC